MNEFPAVKNSSRVISDRKSCRENNLHGSSSHLSGEEVIIKSSILLAIMYHQQSRL